MIILCSNTLNWVKLCSHSLYNNTKAYAVGEQKITRGAWKTLWWGTTIVVPIITQFWQIVDFLKNYFNRGGPQALVHNRPAAH